MERCDKTVNYAGQELHRNFPPDVLVAVGDYPSTAFLSHSSLLAQQSVFFQNSLSINPFSRMIHLPTVNVQAFSYIFTYFYTNYLALNSFNVHEILRTANYLHITSVINLCEQYLTAATAEVNKPTWKVESLISTLSKNKTSDEHQPQAESTENQNPIVEQREKTEPKFNLNLSFNQPSQSSDQPASELKLGTSDIAYCDGPIRFQKIPNLNCLSDESGSSSSTNMKRTTGFSNPVTPTKQQKRVRFICHFCDKQFLTKVSFLKHLELHKDGGTENRTTTSGENSNQPNFQYYKCKLCDCKFPSYYFVHKHRKRFHKED